MNAAALDAWQSDDGNSGRPGGPSPARSIQLRRIAAKLTPLLLAAAAACLWLPGPGSQRLAGTGAKRPTRAYPPKAVVFAADGAHIVARYKNNRVGRWDWRDGQATGYVEHDVEAPDQESSAVAPLANGLVLFAGVDRRNDDEVDPARLNTDLVALNAQIHFAVVAIHPGSGAVAFRHQTNGAANQVMLVAKSGRRFLFGGNDQFALHDASGAALRPFPAANLMRFAPALDAEGRRFVHLGNDNAVHVWDAEADAAVLTLKPDVPPVIAVLAGADCLAVVDERRGLTLYDCPSGRLRVKVDVPAAEFSLVTPVDEDRLLVAQGTGRTSLVDLKTGRETWLLRETGDVTLRARPLGPRTFITVDRGMQAVIWRRHKGEKEPDLGLAAEQPWAGGGIGTSPPTGAGPAFTGLAGAEPPPAPLALLPGGDRIDRLLEFRISMHLEEPRALVSPDGRLILVPLNEPQVRVLATGAWQATMHPTRYDEWNDVRWSPDGRAVICSSNHGSHVMDAASGAGQDLWPLPAP